MDNRSTGRRSFYRGTLRKTAAILAAFLLLAFNFGGMMKGVREVPEAFYAVSEADLYGKLSETFLFSEGAVKAEASGDETLGRRTVTCSLFGILPIKSVPAYVSERPSLIPGGQAVGISIYTEGVLIVGIAELRSDSGPVRSPAQLAGLRTGDVILSVNGRSISSSSELSGMLESGCEELDLVIERSGERLSVKVIPELTENGERRIGVWVRDSTVGVGTLSFCDPETLVMAALGHAVTDADTGSLLKVKDGRLVLAEIIGVTKGRQGAPGELHGTFGASSFQLGEIDANTELGVFGSIGRNALSALGGSPIETAFPDEVSTGEAYIISSADGEPKAYSCRIVKTGRQNEPAPKGLVVEITDERLIEFTGGIVQGMSGSPIIQNGRLVGAVTHVFVNDPLKGYGAYAYWMYKRYGG